MKVGTQLTIVSFQFDESHRFAVDQTMDCKWANGTAMSGTNGEISGGCAGAGGRVEGSRAALDVLRRDARRRSAFGSFSSAACAGIEVRSFAERRLCVSPPISNFVLQVKMNVPNRDGRRVSHHSFSQRTRRLVGHESSQWAANGTQLSY